MSAPSVVLASTDVGLIRLVAAAFEEEAVPLQILAEPISARAAAVRSPLGIGLAVDGTELVVALSTGLDGTYLRGPLDDARLLGRAAARLAARRPLGAFAG
ncbi:MAG: hypothetical protein EXQ67_03885 [Thermoleophilia bacterium]|nr:hypothetical protein [Thermoleophilia bacterium]